MKTSHLRCLVIALLLGSVAVPGSPRTKKPRLPGPDPISGSIGIRITLRTRSPPLIGPGLPAVQVFLVKLEDGSEAFSATELIPSNYSNRKQVYLLNADPGRYVAVAAGLGSTKEAFFSMAMISDTEVTVGPQEMAFMGEYVVSTSTKMKNADEAQAHYYRLHLPGVAGRGVLARMASGQAVYTADIKSVAKDTATERGFWTKALGKAFKDDPRWQARARRQLAALSEQDPN